MFTEFVNVFFGFGVFEQTPVPMQHDSIFGFLFYSLLSQPFLFTSSHVISLHGTKVIHCICYWTCGPGQIEDWLQEIAFIFKNKLSL